MAARCVDSKTDQSIRKIALQLIKEWKNVDEVAAVLGCPPDVIDRLHMENHTIERSTENPCKDLGRPTKLSANQISILKNMVFTTTPKDLNYSTLLWSNKIIREIVFDLFQTKLSLATVNALTIKMGICRRHIFREKHRINNDHMGEWFRNRLPLIRKIAKENHARIFFVYDASIKTTSLDKRDKKEIIGRESINNQKGDDDLRFLSANCLRKSQRFITFWGDLSGLQLINFIKRLMMDIKRPLFLIFDPHYQKLLIDAAPLLSSHDKQVAFFYLPKHHNGNHKNEHKIHV